MNDSELEVQRFYNSEAEDDEKNHYVGKISFSFNEIFDDVFYWTMVWKHALIPERAIEKARCKNANYKRKKYNNILYNAHKMYKNYYNDEIKEEWLQDGYYPIPETYVILSYLNKYYFDIEHFNTSYHVAISKKIVYRMEDILRYEEEYGDDYEEEYGDDYEEEY